MSKVLKISKAASNSNTFTHMTKISTNKIKLTKSTIGNKLSTGIRSDLKLGLGNISFTDLQKTKKSSLNNDSA